MFRYYVTTAIKARCDGMTMERSFYDIMNPGHDMDPYKVLECLKKKGLEVV